MAWSSEGILSLIHTILCDLLKHCSVDAVDVQFPITGSDTEVVDMYY